MDDPATSPPAAKPAKFTKKAQRKELVWRRPEGMKFDITSTERVDEATWGLLDSLCPNKRVLLQYSTGKDASAAWLELAERGYTVVPVFKEIFPGLSFFDDVIKAHEDFFKTEVHIVSSKIAFFEKMRMFNAEEDLARYGKDFKDEALFQCTSKSALTRYRRLLVDTLLDEHDCDVCIIGTKASDSLHRRTHFTVDGPYLPSERLFSLVWRIKKSAPFDIMLAARLPMPRYYLWLGRSPELTLPHEFSMIKKYYPEDYTKLCHWMRNLDAYTLKYEMDNSIEHLLKPMKRIIEAHEKGYPFV